MRSRVYKTVRCPSVRQSVSLSRQSNAAAVCCGFAAERRTRKRYRSTAPGSSSAAAQDSRINEAEHRLGLLSILDLLKFQQCSLLVWDLCPDGNMHGFIHRHIGRTGLGWIDGQKSPVFRRGKSGNPSWAPQRGLKFKFVRQSYIASPPSSESKNCLNILCNYTMTR